MSSFWKMRAKYYNSLDWANDKSYLEKIVELANLKSTDLVLDAGTGTGIVAKRIAPIVGRVFAIDTSKSMISKAKKDFKIIYGLNDLRNMSNLANNIFDKVIARMVFHHIIKLPQKAMNECYRILKPAGLMILSEGVPPTEEVKQDYINIFSLKEERLTFMPKDLVLLMKKANFQDIKVTELIIKQMSIRNWLENSGLSKERQKQIYMLHKNARPKFKEAYNVLEKNNDCYIDIRQLILVGRKK